MLAANCFSLIEAVIISHVHELGIVRMLQEIGLGNLFGVSIKEPMNISLPGHVNSKFAGISVLDDLLRIEDSVEEFLSIVALQFDELDVREDGTVSIEELTKSAAFDDSRLLPGVIRLSLSHTSAYRP